MIKLGICEMQSKETITTRTKGNIHATNTHTYIHRPISNSSKAREETFMLRELPTAQALFASCVKGKKEEKWKKKKIAKVHTKNYVAIALGVGMLEFLIWLDFFLLPLFFISFAPCCLFALSIYISFAVLHMFSLSIARYCIVPACVYVYRE